MISLKEMQNSNNEILDTFIESFCKYGIRVDKLNIDIHYHTGRVYISHHQGEWDGLGIGMLEDLRKELNVEDIKIILSTSERLAFKLIFHT